MKYLLALLVWLWVSVALAAGIPQWYTPYGLGIANSSLGSVAPGTAGQLYTSSGASSAASFQPLTGSQLPLPTSGALGGVKSATASANFVMAGIDTSGNPVFYPLPIQSITCDAIKVASSAVSITATSTALTVVGASFVSGDVGKSIAVPGAGTTVSVAGTLETTIASVTDSTHIGLTAAAATTVSAAAKTVWYGTNEASAFQTLIGNGGTINLGTQQCMLTSSVTVSKPVLVTSSGTLPGTLVFRTYSTTPVTPLLLNSGGAGASFSNFIIDQDQGGNIGSGSGAAYAIDADGFKVLINNVEVNGNRATEVYPDAGGFGSFGSFSSITNSYVHDIGSYPIRALPGASHVQVISNRILDGPKVGDATGFIAFLSSGVTSSMSDLNISFNSIDMTDLASADMNSGVYVYGGSTSHRYTLLSIIGNNVAGVPVNASTSVGVICQFCANVAANDNVVSGIGEGIGFASSIKIEISGNNIDNFGSQGIEVNNSDRSNTTANIISGGSTSADAIGIESSNYSNESGNTITLSPSPATVYGIAVTNTTGSTSFATANDNTILMPAAGTAPGIFFYNGLASSSMTYLTAVGNTIGGTTTAGSVGIYADLAGGTTLGTLLIGPNNIVMDTGVKLSAGVTNDCLVPGLNNSTTPVSNSGAASSCH